MAIDYEALFGGVEYDPCAALQALRPAYMRLVAGETTQKVTFRDRDAWFFRGDTAAFRALIEQLENECAIKNGVTIRRRMAITGGYRRA